MITSKGRGDTRNLRKQTQRKKQNKQENHTNLINFKNSDWPAGHDRVKQTNKKHKLIQSGYHLTRRPFKLVPIRHPPIHCLFSEHVYFLYLCLYLIVCCILFQYNTFCAAA